MGEGKIKVLPASLSQVGTPESSRQAEGAQVAREKVDCLHGLMLPG